MRRRRAAAVSWKQSSQSPLLVGRAAAIRIRPSLSTPLRLWDTDFYHFRKSVLGRIAGDRGWRKRCCIYLGRADRHLPHQRQSFVSHSPIRTGLLQNARNIARRSDGVPFSVDANRFSQLSGIIQPTLCHAADIRAAKSHVRFTPESGQSATTCPPRTEGILMPISHDGLVEATGRSLLHLKSVDGHLGIVRGRPRFDGWRRNVPRGCTSMEIGRGIYLRGRDSFGRSLRG
jgi:hypothetical protein